MLLTIPWELKLFSNCASVKLPVASERSSFATSGVRSGMATGTRAQKQEEHMALLMQMINEGQQQQQLMPRDRRHGGRRL